MLCLYSHASPAPLESVYSNYLIEYVKTIIVVVCCIVNILVTFKVFLKTLKSTKTGTSQTLPTIIITGVKNNKNKTISVIKHFELSNFELDISFNTSFCYTTSRKVRLDFPLFFNYVFLLVQRLSRCNKLHITLLVQFCRVPSVESKTSKRL